ncbi:SdpI family protein [Nesterenkonia haasae]|uniref:hypothetical protein n=1 Tax=Nesterenkonia haasae TaxID=2587813 RepID=UPI001391EE55|nr:hypothetical protein [Nesterenkonia haasae]NDK32824.1 hypothetical protein [Nesterenkonia haasae]
MSASATKNEQPAVPYLGRRLVWGVLIPVFVTGAAFILALSWAPRLPEEVALHWGEGVNRTGPVDELLWTNGAIAVLSLVTLAVFALTVGRTSFVRRLVLGLATGQSVFFAGLLLAPLAVQLDTESGTVPEGLGANLLVAAALGLCTGIVAALAAGNDGRLPATGRVAGDKVHLGTHERAVWTVRVTPAPKLLVVGALGGAAVLGILAWVSWISDSWFGFVAGVMVLALVSITLVWRVRVDSRGLTAQTALGWPRLHVPSEEVEGAESRVVASPLKEFGGWGIRTSLSEPSGTVGVIIRGGDAIDISRSGQRRVVVTVNDASTGAALLNTLAQRSRTTLDSEI